MKTRTNTHILYNNGPYRNVPHTPPTHSYIGVATQSPAQQSTYKRVSTQNKIHLKRVGSTHILQAFRVTFSLLIAGLALALCILYSWTTLLILSLVCATLTLIMIHLLFDEATYTTVSDEPQQHNINNMPYLLPSRRIEPPQASGAPLPSVVPIPAPISVSPTHSQPLEEAQPTQPIQRQASDTPASPTTPMPATPIVRVLETIDLSSTNVEHFLDIRDEWHNIPASQLPASETLSDQGKLSAEPPPEK